MDDLADLYARHHDDVRRFALFLTGDPARADDLTSETFVRAWAARGRIAAPSVRAYLLTITRNLHRDEWRRTRRFVSLEPTIADESEPVDSRVHHAVRLDGVRRALAGVAPGDRRALLLHAASGLTYVETARRLGITLAAVKSRIFRARAALLSITAHRHGGPS
jgi:RNA polymerase sigma factor (sigma-70 family)